MRKIFTPFRGAVDMEPLRGQWAGFYPRPPRLESVSSDQLRATGDESLTPIVSKQVLIPYLLFHQAARVIEHLDM